MTQVLLEKDRHEVDGCMDMSDHYHLYADCRNCGFHDKVWIKKGEMVSGAECPVCGCSTLLRVSTAQTP